MTELNNLIETTEQISNGRREFLEKTGMALLSTTLLANMASGQTLQPKKKAMPQDTSPVETPKAQNITEKQDAPAFAPLPPDNRLGFAIVGLGKLSLEQIMPAFAQSKYCKPVALVSGHRDKAEKVAMQYDIKPTSIYNYQDYDNMKNNPDIDIVYIVLPNSMHLEYTVRAAKAGKHVLSEKPMANSSKDGQQMVDACKAAGVKLMIAYRIQYEPNNNLAKKWVREKTYGNVKLIESTNVQNMGDPKQWRLKKALAGGGPLPDVGIYCLNTIRFLTGEEPEWVLATQYATPGDERFKEVEETVMFQLGFGSGLLANCTCGYSVHDSKRYRAFTDNGAWFGLDPAYAYNGLKMEISKAEGKSEWKQNPTLGDKNQFALEMDHMAQCVMQKKQPYTPGEEGVQDMKLIEAIYESARTGKMVKLAKTTDKDAFRGPEPEKEA